VARQVNEMSLDQEQKWITGEEFARENRRLIDAGVPDDAPEVEGVLAARREAIRAAAARHGATRVRLFGSVARGEAGPDSDVDLLVEFAPDRSLLDHAALIDELEDLLGCEVDVVNERALRPELRERVLREAVPV
jgi:uncharacterized protein